MEIEEEEFSQARELSKLLPPFLNRYDLLNKINKDRSEIPIFSIR